MSIAIALLVIALGAAMMLCSIALGYRFDRGAGELIALLVPFLAAMLFGQTIGRFARPFAWRSAAIFATAASIAFIFANDKTLDWIERSNWADTNSSSMDHLLPLLVWLSWIPSIALSGIVAARMRQSRIGNRDELM